MLLLLLACSPGASSDADRDGYVDVAAGGRDCDDLDSSTWPGADERCDGRDNDCDGEVDEGALGRYFGDLDGDGYGDPALEVLACERPLNHRLDSSDCDDADPAVHPAAPEVCDAVDQDCDGEVDEGAERLWYQDSDGDGVGGAPLRACEAPSGAVAEGGDCHDGDPEAFPGAPERCNGLDDDCDERVDEDAGGSWVDADFDGYGDPDQPLEDCGEGPGRADNADDCDDGNAARYPEALEACDGWDNDCDGLVDEDVKAGWMLVTLQGDGVAYEVDVSTGALYGIEQLRPLVDNVTSLDVREDGLVLAIDNSGGPRLVELDICAGTSTNLGDLDSGTLGGVGFGPNGDLFGLDYSNDALVTVDPSTAAVTEVGPLGFDLGWDGVAWSCADQLFYAVDGPSDQLFTIDPVTGLADHFMSLDVSFSAVGLEYEPSSGTLLASTGTALYRLDPATGASTLLANLAQRSVNDLALHPACP
ncbi:MAG: hypothetical protein H6740_08515 [Alphaproteobacteria bacterium]|nr:hypothetical protein [Alphaproteobacteria bacterium]